MVKEIRVYVEGGGPPGNTDVHIRLRRGFKSFVQKDASLGDQVKSKISFISCGGRGDAFNDFQRARRSNPDCIIILLVDSECPVEHSNPWLHLEKYDRWDISGLEDVQCQLMVQNMEAWIAADVKALETFYGTTNFKSEYFSLIKSVEALSKRTLDVNLRAATRRTDKGKYHKTRHAPDIIALLDPSVVRNKASYCNRFFKTLADIAL